MSERYSRPCTPPGAPPGPRKSSVRGSSTSAPAPSSSSKSKGYDDEVYDKYNKPYVPSSYHTKPYMEDKYKTGDTRKMNDKVPNKLMGKNIGYDDLYKPRDVGYTGDRYADRYTDKALYPERSRLDPNSQPYSKYRDTKLPSDYDAYSEKTSKYPKLDSDPYYGSSASSYSNYNSYDNYGGDRLRMGGYGPEKNSLTGSYGAEKYGGRGGPIPRGGPMPRGGNNPRGGAIASYGADKLPLTQWDKVARGDSYTDKRGLSGYPGDRGAEGSSLYRDQKMTAAPRSRLYPDDDRPLYRDYSPGRTLRSPLAPVPTGYGDYDRYSPPRRSPNRQYLDRYVIGDSVVYGPPGQYPRNLSTGTPKPPTPPSTQPVPSRDYGTRYSAATSPRSYWPSGRRSPPPPATSQSRYRSLSPLPNTSPRRPPSPLTRRPPSPHSPYLASHSRNRERSLDRSKDRYDNKGKLSSSARSPARDSKTISDRRGADRSRGNERDRRKESERRVNSRERAHDSDSLKRARPFERNSDYRSNNDARSWPKESHSSQTQEKERSRERRSPVRGRQDVAKDRSRREAGDSRDRDGKTGRRMEDRLGPTASGSRRSPGARARVSRRASPPRERKRSRRPDDLRLWIESRKSEGGRRPLSPSRSRLASKRAARSSDDRSTAIKRGRLGDPKKRMGGGKVRRRALPIRKNKILKKYRRLTAKRGPRTTGTAGSRTANRTRENRNKDGDGEKNHEGGGDGTNKPGSTGTIRRVIKKPKVVSHVNRLALKPRVIRKPAQKLLRDPKETVKEKDSPRQQSSKGKEERSSPKEDKPSSSGNSESSKKPARTF